MENLEEIDTFFGGFYYLMILLGVTLQSLFFAFQSELLDKICKYFIAKPNKGTRKSVDFPNGFDEWNSYRQCDVRLRRS